MAAPSRGRCGRHSVASNSAERAKAKRRQVDPLPLAPLTVRIPTTPELDDEIGKHNDAVAALADEWDRKTSWPDVDPLTCRAGELNALRERRVADELELLQRAAVLGRNAPLFERLGASWNAIGAEVNPGREKLISDTMDTLRSNGIQNLDERQLRGMVNGSSELKDFDECARHRGDHRQHAYHAVQPARDAAAVIAQRLDELSERLLS